VNSAVHCRDYGTKAFLAAALSCGCESGYHLRIAGLFGAAAMHKRLAALVALFGYGCCCPVIASPVATATGLQTPVWLWLDDGKARLQPDDGLEIGDRVITGNIGRLEMLLWSGVTLQLYENTEIGIDSAGMPESPEAADTAETETSPPAEVASENSSGGEAGRSYTVYLFSTRSATVADRLNRKFRTAGYKSVILRRETRSTIRYRVVVPGFESRKSARQFADSIVGKLGISKTRIGEGKPDSL